MTDTYYTYGELVDMLKRRNVKGCSRMKKGDLVRKIVQIERPRELYPLEVVCNSYTRITDLKSILINYGLPSSGVKSELLYRIINHYVTKMKKPDNMIEYHVQFSELRYPLEIIYIILLNVDYDTIDNLKKYFSFIDDVFWKNKIQHDYGEITINTEILDNEKHYIDISIQNGVESKRFFSKTDESVGILVKFFKEIGPTDENMYYLSEYVSRWGTSKILKRSIEEDLPIVFFYCIGKTSKEILSAILVCNHEKLNGKIFKYGTIIQNIL